MSGKLYDVPANTAQAFCGKCKAEIYFVKTPKGASMPIDCHVPDGRPPVLGIDGLGVSHFETCSAASYYSGRNRK